MDTNIIFWVVSATLIATGLLRLFTPVFPGSIFLFAGFLLGAEIDNFSYIGGKTLAILGGMSILLYLLDRIPRFFEFERLAISVECVTGSLIGTLAGIFFGVCGIVLGPFIGAVFGGVLAQYRRHRTSCFHLGRVWWQITGTAAKVTIAVFMVVMFLAFRLA